MITSMSEVINDLAGHLKQQEGPYIVGISGHGGAGKTTFAEQLLIALDDEAQYLNTDVYITSRQLRYNTVMSYNYKGEQRSAKMTASHAGAHHVPSLERDIRMLREQRELLTIDAPYEKSRLITCKYAVSIIEGMTVAFCDPQLFDLTIYIYCDEATEYSRRSRRDVEERGISMEVLSRSQTERRIQYENFMHPLSSKFRIIINTSQDKFSVEKFELQLR